MSRDVGIYADVLNDLLFEHMATEDGATRVMWLDTGKWLIMDAEEPGVYVVELYPAKTVRDV